MKKFLALVSCFAFTLSAYSQPATAVSVIPQPVSFTLGNGSFLIPDTINIIVNDNEEIWGLAGRLADRLQKNAGIKAIIKPATNTSATSHAIHLNLLPAANSLPKEGYRLAISPGSITLSAPQPAGIFYGIQTLLQLLPIDRLHSPVSVPVLTIEDYPRFGWRGLMLDVARHFFTKQEVKDFIDEMAAYKFNLLHWHLTDDQGWRIEIKSLPKLTEVGAWRVEKTGTFGTFSPPAPNEPRNYGGFYTQDDIREIIQYAKERYIDILPEVDVPGHSLAAIASYPELSCTPGKYAVNSGEKLMVWPPGGHFYGLIDNTLCPANEKTYKFMDKVFTEIAALFPFEYIHMGGDETARNFWEKSAQVKALMKKEKLKNLDEVQSYFVKRIEQIINSKGKKMIGWDEILDGGLAPNAAVMSWRGMKGGIEAARQGHEVVMSPTDFAYIDYMQGDIILEPPVYSTLRLKKAYQFEPLPDLVDPVLIKGGQANLWTEQIYNVRHRQYMEWPRAMAIAEALWSPKKARNWNNFAARVEQQFPRLEAAGIKYSPAIYDPEFEISKTALNNIIVKMTTEIEGLDIHYSFDNSFPDQYYPRYTAPLLVPKDASALKVITYRHGKPIGRMMVMTIEEMKKRAKIK